MNPEAPARRAGPSIRGVGDLTTPISLERIPEASRWTLSRAFRMMPSANLRKYSVGSHKPRKHGGHQF